MKKAYTFITIILLALAMGSCETLNEDVLDRPDSEGGNRDDNQDENNEKDEQELPFVTFSTSSIIISESADNEPTTIDFTIRCHNIKNDKDSISVTYAFDTGNYATDEQAIEGKHFAADGNRTVSLRKSHPSTAISIKVIDNAELSGDHYFDIIFSDTTGCVTSIPNRLSVRIVDDEDAQNTIVGTYLASAQSMLPDAQYNNWNVDITRHATNENILYIHPISIFMGLSATSIAPICAIQDNSSNTLLIEYGQSLINDTTTGYNYTFVGISDDNTPITTGHATATFHCNESGKYIIEFLDNIGVANLANTQTSMPVQALTNVKFEMQ